MRKSLLLISSIVLLNACTKLSTEQENSKQNTPGFATRQESTTFSETVSLTINSGLV